MRTYHGFGKYKEASNASVSWTTSVTTQCHRYGPARSCHWRILSGRARIHTHTARERGQNVTLTQSSATSCAVYFFTWRYQQVSHTPTTGVWNRISGYEDSSELLLLSRSFSRAALASLPFWLKLNRDARNGGLSFKMDSKGLLFFFGPWLCVCTLILTKGSTMSVFIPIDLSTRFCIPLPHFFMWCAGVDHLYESGASLP